MHPLLSKNYRKTSLFRQKVKIYTFEPFMQVKLDNRNRLVYSRVILLCDAGSLLVDNINQPTVRRESLKIRFTGITRFVSMTTSNNATDNRKQSHETFHHFPYHRTSHCCGYYAAMRWLENQTGCNRATAIRCIQAAKLCEAMNKIS